MLGVFATAVACGPKDPTIKFQNANCNDPRVLDLEPGDVVDISDVGEKSDFEITADGIIYVPGVSDRLTDPKATDYIFGEKDKPHYIVKSTGNGNGDVEVKRVCPTPPKPTPTPTKPSSLHGSQRYAAMAPNFHPGKASKSVFSGRIRF
ncbi:hypothetical protein H3C65_04260 [Patescibacteria group bacterium]|nr:hypothetical protein [Patescibacteria group bacterium]